MTLGGQSAGPDELHFVVGPIARFTGGLLCALGLCIFALSVWEPSQRWPGVGVAVGLALLGSSALRLGVHATNDGLRVCSGLRQRRYRWQDVDGFRLDLTPGSRSVLALVRGNASISLPIPNSGLLSLSGRDATRIRDALEEYRLAIQGRAAPG